MSVARSHSRACSVFAASSGRRVLIGNNEDASPTAAEMNAQLTFRMATAGATFGKLFFHMPEVMNDFPQGGMNTAGLFIDALTTPPPTGPVQYPDGTEEYPGGTAALLHTIFDRCAHVDEALAMLTRFTLPEVDRAQLFVADRTGAAAVLGVDHDNRIAVTRKTGPFLLATNFSLADPRRGNYPEPRYALGSQYWQEHPRVTVRNALTLLAALHLEADPVTIYSNIYDLRRREMYLYYFHNYADVVKIHLPSELAIRGSRTVPVRSLFPVEPFAVSYTMRIHGARRQSE